METGRVAWHPDCTTREMEREGDGDGEGGMDGGMEGEDQKHRLRGEIVRSVRCDV